MLSKLQMKITDQILYLVLFILFPQLKKDVEKCLGLSDPSAFVSSIYLTWAGVSIMHPQNSL